MSDSVAWRCRRGLLELDLWLGGFWKAHRATLRAEEIAAFERLLILSDMEILDWLQGNTVDDEAPLAALIQRLRAYTTHDEKNCHPDL